MEKKRLTSKLCMAQQGTRGIPQNLRSILYSSYQTIDFMYSKEWFPSTIIFETILINLLSDKDAKCHRASH